MGEGANQFHSDQPSFGPGVVLLGVKPRSYADHVCTLVDLMICQDLFKFSPLLSIIPLSFPQACHQTVTESEKNQHLLLQSAVRHQIFYPVSVSSVPAGVVTLDTPIAVLNSGTPQYKDAIHGSLVTSININSLVNKYMLPIFRDPVLNRRGNFQITFGIAGSQNVGPPADPTANFGVTVPRVLANTFDREVLNALQVGWEIGKLIKVPFCQDHFLKENPQHSDYFQFIQETLGRPHLWACMSLCCLRLRDGAGVKPHVDRENCPSLTTVLNVSWILLLDGHWCRISAVFCMRKSIYCMLLRRGACSEISPLCERFLSDCAPYRLPTSDARSIYEEGVGSQGILVTIDSKRDSIVGLALLGQALCDKQAHFLGPVVSSIVSLLQHQRLVMEELIEILCLVGYLNGYYSLINLLGKMQSGWDREESRSLPGGLIQYIIQQLILTKGSISGGHGFRCQPFTTKNLPVSHIKRNCYALRTLVKGWTAQAKAGAIDSVRDARQLTQKSVQSISKELNGVGTFTSHHILHTAALGGMAPFEFLNYSVVMDATKPPPKRPTMFPKLYAYLKHGVSKKTTSETMGRYSVLLTSTTRYLKEKMMIPSLTESMMENILCESKRRRIVNELWFPGQGIYSREERNGTWFWHKTVPRLLVDGGTIVYQTEDLPSFTELLADDSSDLFENSSTLWDKWTNPQEDDIVAVNNGQESQPWQREIKIPASYIQEHFPMLMAELRVTLAEHPGKRNDFNDYMERLNAMPNLLQMISCYEAENGSRQKGKLDKRRNRHQDSGKSNRKKTRKSPKTSEATGKNVGLSTSEQGSSPTQASVEFVAEQPTTLSQNGITYRVYQTIQQARGVLQGIDSVILQLAHINSQKHPLNNDVHAAMVHQMANSQEREKVARIRTQRADSYTNSKEGSKGNLLISKYALSPGVSRYKASLEIMPHLSNYGCLVLDAIAKALGGNCLNEDHGEGWCFDSQESAAEHVLLAALCTVGTPKFYLTLLNRVLRNSGRSEPWDERTNLVTGYWTQGSKKEISYYLMVAPNPSTPALPTLTIVIPPRTGPGGRSGGDRRKGLYCGVRLL
jgi:hypothetical protein